MTLLTDQINATSIDFHFASETTANVTVQLYVVRSNTLEKIKTVDSTLTVDSDATYTIDSEAIVTTNSGKVYYSDVANIELVISSDAAITVDNPVVTHLV